MRRPGGGYLQVYFLALWRNLLRGRLGRIWALTDGSRLDFEGFREALGKAFESPGALFSKFLHARARNECQDIRMWITDLM